MTFTRNVYFPKTNAVYRSGYLGALRVTVKMPVELTSQMPIRDFDWCPNMLQIYTHHRQQFAASLPTPFYPLELTFLDIFHSWCSSRDVQKILSLQLLVSISRF